MSHRKQRKRLKEEQQNELQGDVKMAEGDLIARVSHARAPVMLRFKMYGYSTAKVAETVGA